jgi:4-hydroxy-tetrahydrodipicolinate reductase
MAKSIKVMIVGAAGLVGSGLVRMLHDKGCSIVAAIGRTRHIGQDAGTVAGIGELGLYIEGREHLQEAIRRTRPDVAINCAEPDLKSVAATIRICLEEAVNVIELSEEACYPQLVDAILADELDALAKKNGVSIVGLGYQDISWNAFAMALAANALSIEEIYGEDWMIADDFAEIAEFLCGAGLSRAEFDEKFGGQLHLKGFLFVLHQIADELGLKVTDEASNVEFIPLESDFYVEKTGAVIPAGHAAGSKTSVRLQTEEGVVLKGCFIAGFRTEGVVPRTYWAVKGKPDICVTIEREDGEILTSYDVANRLPDVLNAQPGFLTLKDLPKASFKAHDLSSYVN